jgi:flavin-dependent dehydrogenase
MKTDVLVIGGGPGGAVAAMKLLELGVRPVIVERETFPRYHIGESMVGELGALLRKMGFNDRMIAAEYPIKHGVNVWGTRGHNDWFLPVMRRDEQGELDPQVTWQVTRSSFDQMLLDEAVARGAQLIHGRAATPIMDDDGTTLRGVTIEPTDGGTLDIHAEMTVDCSGQATFLANRKVTGPKYLGAYDKQIAIFTQVANYVKGEGTDRVDQPGNTHIFYKKKYHWGWGIPIDPELTSIGIVIPAAYFRESGESKADFVAREIRELNAGLSERVPVVELEEDPHVIPNYSFQVRKFAGHGYLCIGDAHRFVDPIFSFGLYLSIKEAHVAAPWIAGYLDGKGRDEESPFHDYMVEVESAGDILEDTIDTFWENPLAFSVFTHNRYRGALIDAFAGRIYYDQRTSDIERAMVSFRKLLGRERIYDNEGLFSMPIGSRFHPERAPLWDSHLDDVETTERWIKEEVEALAAG